jgi:hypothetical protein
VQVHIAHDAAGGAAVTVQVERPETLHMLQQDVSHLHQALDRAGVPAEARQLSLHLAPAVAASAGGQDAGSLSSGGNGGDGQRQAPQPRQAQRAAAADAAEETHGSQPAWQPAGLNITA